MNKSKIVIWISRVVAFAAVVSYLVALFASIGTGLIPQQYLIAAIVGSAVIMLLLLAAAFRWRKSVKINVILALIFLIITGASIYTFTTATATNSFIQNISSSESEDIDLAKPFVLYISGIDSAENPAANARSDVNMLAVINPTTNQMLLVNTPRDYYVTLADIGARDKLTHAGLYGIDTSMETLANLYEVPVDYYLRINFASLVQTIDALGGVDVVSDYAFSAGGYNFQQGVNQLDGEAALAFSRERYSFEGGDRTRGQNQQRVIEAIVRKLTSPAGLANYQSTLASLEGGLLTNISSESVQALLNRQLTNPGDWQTESISVTGFDSQNTTHSTGDQLLYVMEPDANSAAAARAKIQQFID